MANIKTTASTKSLLSVTQAAKILKVSPDTLRNWEKSGKLIPERTPGGARRYQLSTLNELKKELNPVQKKKGMLSISKAAKELGVSSDTLRNWEKKGLIQTDRTDGGARRYSKAQLTELKAELGLDDRKKKVSDRNTAEFIPTELNNPQIPAQAQIFNPIINSEINNTTGHEAKKIVLGTVFSTFRLAIPLFLMLLVFIPLLVFNLSSEPKTDSLKQGDYDKKIYDLASSVESLQNTLFSLTSEASDSAKFTSEQNVLAVSTIANLGKYIEVNADTSIAGNLAVDGEAIFGENITAPNIVYGLIAGTNVTITGDPQNPVISSTGATEVDTLATVTARGATTTAPVTLAGGVTISNVLTLGQLDSDPTTGSNGGIYYNTASNKYRCYINGSWGDCDTDTDTVQEAIGDITSVTLGNGLNGGGTTGDITVNLEIPTTGATTTTGSNSGLELTADGLSLVRGCINNQSLIWDSTLEQWKCGALNAVITIQEGDADVSTNASVVDFLGADFAVNESPSSEVNVSIDYANSHITRDNQTQSISGAWTMGDLTISDANVTLSGASTTFTQTTGAISFVPAAGSNFDISLSGTGDFAVNGNHLYVDTSTGYVGIGDNSPTAQLTIGSGDLFQVTAAGNVVFNQTSPSIAIGNTGVLTITDGTNTLLSLSDNGTAGTLNINTLTASVISGHTLAGNVVGSGSPTLSGLGTINGATISGGTISGGTLSGGTYTATGSTVAGNHTATIGDGGSFNVSDGTNLIFTVSDSGTVGNLTNIGTISTTGAITQAGQTLDNTYVNVAENPTAADIGGSFQAGLTINADSVALGTDTTGDYVANVTAGSGLTGSVTGEGSTPTLAVGTGNGITVNADDVAVDQGFNFIFTGNVGFTPSGTGDVTVSIDADSSFILDNIQSGTPASSLCVDSNDVVITCTVSGSGDITAVGDVTSGDAFTNGGSGNSLYFNNNANTGQLIATTLTGTRTYTLPDASGTVCLSSGNCSASGVTSLNGLTGALTIANATGVGSTITIDDATTAAKGIASFSSSNFAVSSGAVSIKSGGVGSTEILDGSVSNADIENSSVTINTAGPLGGGGAVSLGGTLNLTCATCLTTSTTLFTLSATSGIDSTISSGDTVTLTAGTGITTTNDGAGEITIANSGVLSNVAGTGISVSGATGNVTITNTGVTSLAGTINQISVSGATGSVTLSLPQDIATTSGVTFATVDTGQGANELYDMDQNVLTTSNVTFENIIGNGNITLGSDSADTVTVNGIVQGASPFVFEGSTPDGFETTFTLTDPTADRTITFQNDDGVVPVATAGNTIFFTTSGNTNLTLPTSGTVCTTATCVTSAVTSATGTANQVLVNGTSGSAQTGAVTFTTPQDIGTTSAVTFATVDTGQGANELYDMNQNVQTSDSVTFANVTLGDTGGLRTGTSAGNTALLQAYDVDGTSYTTFATLTAGNTPTFDLSGTVTIGGNYIYRAGGNDVAVADGGTGISTVATNGQLLIGNGTGYTLGTITEGEGIDVTNGSGSITLAAEDASDTNKGIASFNATNFTVTSGDVAIANNGVTLGTHTTGNYVATVAGSSQIGVSGSGSENAAVSLSLQANSVDATHLSSTLTLADGDYLDLSAIAHDDAALQGFRLPNTSSTPTNPTSGEGQLAYDASGNVVIYYDGASWQTLSSTGTSGDITDVNAGAGLTGGGSSGAVTLNIGSSSTITVNADDIAVTADSIGDTELAFNTGQHLTSTSAVTFATVDTGQGANELYDMDQNVTTTSNVSFADLTVNGNTTLGSDSADTVTVNGIVQGASPFVFEGATADGFETTFALTDPTADRTITFQDSTGVVPVATAGNTIFFTTSGNTSLTLPTSGTVCTTATCVTSAVTTATGTANQVLVNGTSGAAQTGTITLTTPQDIGTSSSVTFGGLTITPAAAGAVTLNQYGTNAGETAELRFKEGGASSTQYVGFKAPDSLTSNAVYILPNHDTSAPSGDYVLTWQSGNVLQWKAGSGVGGVGDITDVTAGTGLTGGGASGAVTLNIGAGDGITVNADDIAVKLLASPTNGASTTVNSASGMEFVSSGSLSLIQGCADTEVLAWDEANDYWECAAVSGLGGVGDITDVTAGAGLTGGGSSGAVSLAIGSSSTITVNADDIAVTADSIGDTELAFNTGQHLTSTSAVTFATVDTGQGANELFDMDQNVTTTSNVTFADLTGNGNIALGSDGSDTVTINGIIQGASPFTFEGTTVDGFETTFALTDPTADRTITFQDNSGVVPVATAGNTIFFTTSGDTSLTLPTSGTVCTTATCLTSAVTSATGTANQVLVNGTSGSAQTGTITLTTPQDIGTGSSVTFATVDTGQGANELYDMNQNVQSSDSVTFANVNLGTGGGLRTGTSNTNTALLQAYDVDGTSYTTFATLTAGNTPTFDLSTATTIGSNTIVSSGNVGTYATTAVTAGSGLTGGGTTGALTLNIGSSSTITVNADDIAVTADSIGDTELAFNTGQHLTSTSAVTFATVDTGQGANELYDMDQNVLTSSDVVFNSVSFEAAGVRLSGDDDGAITFLGLGDGNDEDLTLNLDDTANTGVFSSSTGLNAITFTGMALSAATDETINGLDINAGSISDVAGYTQSTGSFAFSGGGNFSVDSAAFDVTTAGVVSGVTGYTQSAGSFNVTPDGTNDVSITVANVSGRFLNIAGLDSGVVSTGICQDGSGNVITCTYGGGNGDITAVGSMTSGDAFADATADNDWLGLGATAGRIGFDDLVTDEVDILDATLDLNANLITNIGNSGTDFTSTGGLTLADDLTVTGNDITFGNGETISNATNGQIRINNADPTASATVSSVLIGDNALVSANAAGQYIGINADNGYTGNLIHFQKNSTDVFRVENDGTVRIATGDGNNATSLSHQVLRGGFGLTISTSNSGSLVLNADDGVSEMTIADGGTIAYDFDVTGGTLHGTAASGAVSQASAYTGYALDLSTNITVPNTASGNQTGIAVTLKDGGASATSVGLNLAGTYDTGINFAGTPGTNLINSSTIDITSGGAITGATGISSSGTINFSGLSASAGVYTDGSSNLTSTPPTSGTLGYWSRTGSILSPANSGDSITTSGDISTSGTGALTVAGATTLNGTVTLGNATSDTITFTGYVGSSIIPSADDTYDLGDDTHRWANLWLGGETLHIGTSTTDEGVLSYTTAGNALLLDNAGTSGSINFGNGTTNPTYLFNGSGTFGTSTGANSLNGDTTVANTKNFVAGQTTGKIGFGGTVSGSDYLMNITLDNTQDWSRGINITQANNVNEDSTVINIDNTVNVGSALDKEIRNFAGTLTPTATPGEPFEISNFYGVTSLANITLGDSNSQPITYGGNFTVVASPTYNSSSTSDSTDAMGVAGFVSGSPTLTSVSALSSYNTYAVEAFNSASSGGNANLEASAYGIRARTTGNLTTTGTTTHYAGYFDSTGTADNNYGLYVNSVASADNNYGLYINTVASAATNYAVYSNAAAQSYFAGNVGIGDSSPAALFTVGDGDDFQINSTGAITAATGISSSGTIAFSNLSTNGVVYTTSGTGTLASEAQLAVTRGGTNTNSIGSAGTVAYSDGSAYGFSAVGNAGECLTSNGSAAPSWTVCATATTSPFTSSAGVITKLTSSDKLNITASEAADYAALFDTSIANSTDLVQISNSGFATVTDGIDGLSVIFANGDGSNNTNAALRIAATSGGGAGDTLYGLRLEGITATGQTESAISIGANWDSYLDTATIDINGSGAITGATGLSSSGTIAFGGLTTDGVVYTSGGNGTLNSEAQLALSRGGTNKNLTAVAGGIAYTDADSLEVTAAGNTGDCLVSQGSSAPAWGTCFAIDADSLDYDDFEDTMDLDANLTLNQTTFTWTQNFTGDTTTAYTLNADSLTTGTAIALSADALTTGKALDITSTAATLTSADLVNIASTGTYTTAQTVSGSLAEISRSLTINAAATTLSVTGPVARISDNCTVTVGTCTSTANTLEVIQNYASNSGSALLVASAGNSSGFVFRANDDGTTTDSTPFVIGNAGNVGIGTTTTSSFKLHLLQGADTSNDGIGIVDATAANSGRIWMNGTDFVLQRGANTDQLVLDNGGNVGIGTNAPADLLTVSGGSLTVTGTSGASRSITLLSGGATDLAQYQIGRASADGQLGVAGGSGQFSNIASQGDIVLRNNTEDLIFAARNASGNIYMTTGAADSAKLTVLSGGNVGVGDTTPDALFDIDSSSTTAPAFSLTQSGAYTGTGSSSVVYVNSAATTGDIFNINGASLTTGSALVVAGHQSVGMTDSVVKLSGMMGNSGRAAGMLSLSTTISTSTLSHESSGLSNIVINSPTGAANNAFGSYTSLADATALANTVIGNYTVTTSTGNAAKALYGYMTDVTTTSTTGDTLTGTQGTVSTATALTGATNRTLMGARGIVNDTSVGNHASSVRGFYGVRGDVTSTTSTNGTTSGVGGYFAVSSANAADAGTAAAYGVLIDSGTSNLNGTSSRYGLYIASQSGADTNYQLYSVGTASSYFGGNIGIGATTPDKQLEIQGAHGTTQMHMHASVNGSTQDGHLYMWASEPGLTWDGVGISSNWRYTGGWARENSSFGGGYMRLASDLISFNTVNSSGTDTRVMTMSGSNVGIGSTSPTSARLVTVNSAGGINPTLDLRSAGTTSGDGPSIIFTDSAGETDVLFMTDSANEVTRIKSRGSLMLQTNDVGVSATGEALTISTAQAIRFNAYGAGTLVTDGSGNISASSDIRLKNVQGAFDKGLNSILGLDPINYKWNSNSGMDTNGVYSGFSAQNVKQFIPEAVGEDSRGYLTLSDRPILAASVNAIKELNHKVENALLTINDQGYADKTFTAKKLSISTDANIAGTVSAGAYALDATKLNQVGTLASLPQSGSGTVSLADAINALNDAQQVQEDSIAMLQDGVIGVQDEIASQSAQLAAQTEKTTELEGELNTQKSALDEIRDQIAAQLGTTSAENDPVLTSPDELTATGSASLAQFNATTMSAKELTVSDTLTSLGETRLGNTILAGDFIQDGTLSITGGNEINVIGSGLEGINDGILYIQKAALARAVDFFNGLVTIDNTGSLKVPSVTVADFKVVAKKISGTATIPAGQTSIIIDNPLVSPNARILVTPTSQNPAILAVTAKNEGESFTVSSAFADEEDITFDWWMVQEVEEQVMTNSQ